MNSDKLLRMAATMLALWAGLTARAQLLDPEAQAFSFQAKLTGVSDGQHLLHISMFDADTGGNQVGGTIDVTADVQNGIVSEQVSIPDVSVFDEGQRLWAEVSVDNDPPLAPRIPLIAVPYSFRVHRVGSVELDDDLVLGSGVASGSLQLHNNQGVPTITLLGQADGNPSIDVTGTVQMTEFKLTTSPQAGYVLTSDPEGVGTWQVLPPAQGGWSLVGNSGTDPLTNFLGTTDDVALELRVNGGRALRLEPDATSPNLIGGVRDNIVTTGVVGATIAGGGAVPDQFNNPRFNQVTDDFGAVGGGRNNQAGDDDGITDNAPNATVAGGVTNKATAQAATVGGGDFNTAGATWATVAGGASNTAGGPAATVAGGYANSASAAGAVVGGGRNNTATGADSTVPGGTSNAATGAGSFAAGSNATADHDGAFVWADSDTVPFQSTGPDQFLIHASGGVGIGTDAPGAMLHIGGTPGADGLMFPDGSLQTTAATGGGDGHWSTNGDHIYNNNAGNVGIGTSTPNHKFEVTHATSFESALFAEHTLPADNTPAILGEHIDSAGAFGIGVQGRGGWMGLEGIAQRSGNNFGYGVKGWAGGTSTGPSYGVRGDAGGAGTNFGVYGVASGGTTNWAGYFDGNGHFSGDVGIGTTSIGDHKLMVTHATGGESAIFAEHTLLGAFDNTPAILGEHMDSTDGFGIGVQGRGGYAGVEGIVDHSFGDGAGVAGWARGTSTSSSYGVYGDASADGTNYGVYGSASGGTTNWAGYFPYGNGYFGGDVGIGTTSVGDHKLKVTHATAGESAIFAEHTLVGGGDNTPAILGEHIDSTGGYGIGVKGIGGWIGVTGTVTRTGDSPLGYGVLGYAGGTSTLFSYGVYGAASADGTNYGVYGTAAGGTTNWAGYFDGNVHVTGDLSADGLKPFRIDHPLDPENKYLYHYALESPEVLNLYRGTVVLDAGGEGWAELPTYFQSINRDFTYQLTAVGAPMPDLHVAQEIDGRRFQIAGGKAGMKVSWQVTAVRNDPYVREYGAPVEVEKLKTQRGLYQHPELYGQPEERGIDYLNRVESEERHPEAAQRPAEPPEPLRSGAQLGSAAQSGTAPSLGPDNGEQDAHTDDRE